MERLIAVLEDDPRRTRAMKEALSAGPSDVEVIFFDNAPDMLSWLAEGLQRVSLLCLDHDLGPLREQDGERFDPGIGRDVVEYLEGESPCCPVVIHSSNGPAADVMLYALQFAGWSAERVFPHDDLTWVEADWIGRVATHLEVS